MTAVSREHSRPGNTGPTNPGPRGRVPVPEAQAHADEPLSRALTRTAGRGPGGLPSAAAEGTSEGSYAWAIIGRRQGVASWGRRSGVDGSCVPVTVRQVAPTIRHEPRRFVPLPHEPSPDMPNRRPERTNRRPERTNRRAKARTVDPSVRTVGRRHEPSTRTHEPSRKHPIRHARSADIRRDPPLSAGIHGELSHPRSSHPPGHIQTTTQTPHPPTTPSNTKSRKRPMVLAAVTDCSSFTGTGRELGREKRMISRICAW